MQSEAFIKVLKLKKTLCYNKSGIVCNVFVWNVILYI